MRRIFISTLILVSILFFACSENSPIVPETASTIQETNALAKKPAPNLLGEMELDFVLVPYTEPGMEDVVWDGTVEFENGGTYGIRFHHLSPRKGYSQASPFEEYFEVYDLGDPSIVYLAGPDAGVTTIANKPPDPAKYRMNGEVDFVSEPFLDWMGRNVHMQGEITWQNLGTTEEPVIVPATAPGILRIN